MHKTQNDVNVDFSSARFVHMDSHLQARFLEFLLSQHATVADCHVHQLLAAITHHTLNQACTPLIDKLVHAYKVGRNFIVTTFYG